MPRPHRSLARSLRGPLFAAVALLAPALLAGCPSVPSYSMQDPPSFKRYQAERGLRMISADGVMLKVREVENYPEAPLAFWVEALARHLDARGYTKVEEKSVESSSGLKGTTLDFLLPRGPEDWVMSETIFVVGDRIVLVEVAGPFERYTPYREELAAALATFDRTPR